MRCEIHEFLWDILYPLLLTHWIFVDESGSSCHELYSWVGTSLDLLKISDHIATLSSVRNLNASLPLLSLLPSRLPLYFTRGRCPFTLAPPTPTPTPLLCTRVLPSHMLSPPTVCPPLLPTLVQIHCVSVSLSVSLSLSLSLSLLVVLGSVGVWRTGTGQDRHPRHPTAAPQTCQTPRPPPPPPRPPSPPLAPASRLTWTNGRWRCACCKRCVLERQSVNVFLMSSLKSRPPSH